MDDKINSGLINFELDFYRDISTEDSHAFRNADKSGNNGANGDGEERGGGSARAMYFSKYIDRLKRGEVNKPKRLLHVG